MSLAVCAAAVWDVKQGPQRSRVDNTTRRQGCSPSLLVLRGDILLPLLLGGRRPARLHPTAGRCPLQCCITDRLTETNRVSLRIVRYLPTGFTLDTACE